MASIISAQETTAARQFGDEHDWTRFFRRRCETGSKSLREIGELFGGLDYAAVAQRIRRTRSAHTAQAKSDLITEMLNVWI